ncbi:hypothetical protein HHO41_04790 [Bacillus sp. DNRA2]|uniref:hypothetical protein n=1 Tax=Bacillus sp. DNRA2 TaxID=2723053 RepID=UPI00145F094B|nr:hypothetical protein [Bacillus sp. DNRA2]NMD69597.1 hypothetical protein [Bacillus sp. DNRA2]
MNEAKLKRLLAYIDGAIERESHSIEFRRKIGKNDKADGMAEVLDELQYVRTELSKSIDEKSNR